MACGSSSQTSHAPVLRPVIGIQPRLSSVVRALPVCVAYVDTHKIAVAVVLLAAYVYIYVHISFGACSRSNMLPCVMCTHAVLEVSCTARSVRHQSSEYVAMQAFTSRRRLPGTQKRGQMTLRRQQEEAGLICVGGGGAVPSSHLDQLERCPQS